jgi:hypothetical protein
MKVLFRYFFIFVFLFICSIFYTPHSAVFAADFTTDYQVNYYLSQAQNNLNSRVEFTIKITNLKSDVYVDKFAISFPKTFTIANLKSSDDYGTIIPKMFVDDLKTKVEMEFSNPNIGKDSVNHFYLSFDQANLFKINGNVWEVILPVMENSNDQNYKIAVNLPEGSNKKISIAKPKPDAISGNQIIWNNPATKTIYAVFGDSQVYQADLTYHLKNQELYPITTEIAFPPDSLYQKTYLQSITPKPDTVYQDEDGNNLGKYYLKPLESKTIILKDLIQVYSKPRDETIPVIRSMINQQKNYLLTSKKYWQINNVGKIESLETPQDIYNYVVRTLQYNYKKINSQNIRLGADYVLTHPDQAVCLEFTDLFIASSREKGIYSREIQGYGFSLDPQLQPLSLSSDVLHAWPEYFDPEKEIWVSVDPTWENTSGIDYFTSFDLNHIIFVIHGKKSDYPLPAGMYKVENSHDISIQPVTEEPIEKKEIVIENINLPSTISDKKIYQGKFSVKNNGNVYLWQIPISIKGENLNLSKTKLEIPVLAPFEKKEITIDISSVKTNKKITGNFSINIYQKQLFTTTINIIPSIYILTMKIFIVIFFISVGFLIYRFLFRIKRK